eukprot:1752759-Pyramimonas_sp.AAC.1
MFCRTYATTRRSRCGTMHTYGAHEPGHHARVSVRMAGAIGSDLLRHKLVYDKFVTNGVHSATKPACHRKCKGEYWGLV